MKAAQGNILILAQSDAEFASLESSLLEKGQNVQSVTSAELETALASRIPDLVIVRLDDLDSASLKVLEARSAASSLLPLLDSVGIPAMHKAMKLGAVDYVELPISDDARQEADKIVSLLDSLRQRGHDRVLRDSETIQKLKQQAEELKDRYIAQCKSFNESQDIFYLDLSRMMSIIDNIRDGIVFTDPDGRVTLMNPVMEHLMGVKSIVAIGKRLDEIDCNSELLSEIATDQKLSVLKGSVSERTLEIHHSVQDLVYLKLLTTAVTDYKESFAGILTVTKDVTAEFKSEQMKNQYLSIVSHELRTPLTGIKTFATLMARGALGELEETQQRVVESIREQALRLEHEIDKIICLGRIESGDFAMDLEVFTIVDLLDLVTVPFEQAAKDRGIDFKFRLPDLCPLVRADREDLRRAIQALIENAIKFTPAGGSVEIFVEDSDDYVEVHVRDNGLGIDQRYQRRIFEKFFQVEDPLTRHHGGAGLGLSVASGVAVAHGGSISVTSELGKGADFMISLPKFDMKELTETS